MINNYKNLILLFLALVLSSCATQPERMYITPSGNIEVTIDAPYEVVKGRFIQKMALDGLNVKSDSDYQTVFIKPCGISLACSTYKIMLGNQYSTDPDLVVTYQWLRTDKGVRIMVTSYEITTTMPFGQVQRASLLGNNKQFNDAMSSLLSFKELLESEQQAVN